MHPFWRYGALVALVLFAAGISGCHSSCSSIDPGTAAGDLPLGSPATSVVPSRDCQVGTGSPDEIATVDCCQRLSLAPADAGVDAESCRHGSYDCSNVQPAEAFYVDGSYSGWECGEYGPVTYFCVAWIRDQRVVGTCSGCPPD